MAAEIALPAQVRPRGADSDVGGSDAAAAPRTFEITTDHSRRTAALNIPGAYYERPVRNPDGSIKKPGVYVVTNPSPRAAAAMIALFPETLVRYPELNDIWRSAYGDARPYSYAEDLGIRLEVGALGDKELHPWQDIDLGYLRAILERDGGIHVGWDRGLGKTLATAALIKALEAKRSLVVARNDAKWDTWEPELREALPDHRILVLPNDKKKREDMVEYIANGLVPEPWVLVIHYEAVKLIAGDKVVHHRDGSTTTRKAGGDGWKRLAPIDLLAYDESHKLASFNPHSDKNTQQGDALEKLRRRYVKYAVNLSGTGIMNHPEDLFGQLHLILPDTYEAKWADWNLRYIDYIPDGYRKVPIGFQLDKLDDLRRELGVFMVHRRKEDVLPGLPPLTLNERHLTMLPGQQRVYNDVRDKYWAQVEDAPAIIAANALTQMNALRQIATYKDGVPSVKLEWVLSTLEGTPDEQFIIFTWYKRPGRALQEILGDDVVVVDGDVPVRHRHELVQRHRRGLARILVGSIKTLGESLNLQHAHNAIRLDRSWNPGENDQTIDRLHRQGQLVPVTFDDLWTDNSVDTLRVYPRLSAKESLRMALYG